MNTLVILLLSLSHSSETHSLPRIVDHVDIIEINHCFDDKFNLRYDMVLYYKFGLTYIKDKNSFKSGYGYELIHGFLISPSVARPHVSDDELRKLEFIYEQQTKELRPKPRFVLPFHGGPFIPNKNYKTGLYHQIFVDDLDSRGYSRLGYYDETMIYRRICIREVISKIYIETFTTYDKTECDYFGIKEMARKGLSTYQLGTPTSI